MLVMAVWALGAVVGCGGPEPGPQEREAAVWVLQKGGTVNVDATTVPVTEPDRLPEASFFVQQIDLHEKNLKNAELQKLVGLETVRELNLYATGISDPALDHLAGLTSLQQLELSLNNITDAGLEKLVRLKGLQKLFLRGTGVTEEGVEKLKNQLPGCTVYQ